jgi:RNA 2',3'-cyclic 3'-phosphodiesterase
MRLFVAVELSDAIRQEAARITRELAEAFGPGARRAVSWVDPSRMHLTVRFIGEVEARAAEELARRLSAPFATRAFHVAVGGVGAFPRSGPPRVVWLGLREGGEALSALHDEFEARLTGLGVEREDRPFRAHLTLGRVKAPLGALARQTIDSLPADDIGGCDIDHCTLFESRPSPHGATYVSLARGPLAP